MPPLRGVGKPVRRYVLLSVSVVLVAILGFLAAWTQFDGAARVNRVHRADRVQLQQTLAGLTGQYLQFTFLSTDSAATSGHWTLRQGSASDRQALQALATSSPLTSYGAAVVALNGSVLP